LGQLTWTFGAELGDVEVGVGGGLSAWDVSGQAGAAITFEDTRVDVLVTGAICIDIDRGRFERFDAMLRAEANASTSMVTEASVGGRYDQTTWVPVAERWIPFPGTPVP